MSDGSASKRQGVYQMSTLSSILAQPLASDRLWLALLFLLVLASMASLNSLRNRIARWRHSRHGSGQRPHRFITHFH